MEDLDESKLPKKVEIPGWDLYLLIITNKWDDPIIPLDPTGGRRIPLIILSLAVMPA
jgi:hypothetical protein